MTLEHPNLSFGQTPWQTVGPFFHFSLPWPSGNDLVGNDLVDNDLVDNDLVDNGGGPVVELRGQLRDGDGVPVPDAMIETWQSDPGHPPRGRPGFGRTCTGEDGTWHLRTRRPGPVPGPGNRPQAPHIAVGIFGRGLIKRLVTRIYFEDSPENQHDPILALVAPERRPTLIAHRSGPGWRFDIVLQGPGETVFFEI